MVADPSEDNKNRLLSLPEAAELFGFNPDYLRTLAQRGRLQARKVGNIWVTTPEAVETYIRSRKPRGRYRSDIQAD